MWRFKVKHVPGKSIPASDAASRYPSLNEDGDVDLSSDPSLDILAALETRDDEDEDVCFEDIQQFVIAGIRSALEEVKAVTWERVKDETQVDTQLCHLSEMIAQGFPSNVKSMPAPLQPYWAHRNELVVFDGVILLGERIVIPQSLRSEVSACLHSAHQGVSGMGNRARTAVFWPGLSVDIQEARNSCEPCDRMAPSQPHLPPVPPFVPTMPFEAIVADYFHLEGYYYLLSADRFSNWTEVKKVMDDPKHPGSAGLIRALKHLFAGFGVPVELSSGGGPEFKSQELNNFLQRWGVNHRKSSAYNPRSNGRAEVAVKAMKRLLRDNIGPSGELDTEKYVRAVLQFRNTPDPDSGLSPAQVLFGHQLRDVLPFKPRTQVFSNDLIRPLWRDNWAQREETLRTRFGKQVEALTAGSRPLPQLNVGDVCRVQNQVGSHPNKWDRTGEVVQVNDNDQYLLKMHGSGRVTLRNRKFLRQIQPYRRRTLSHDCVFAPPPHPSSNHDNNVTQSTVVSPSVNDSALSSTHPSTNPEQTDPSPLPSIDEPLLPSPASIAPEFDLISDNARSHHSQVATSPPRHTMTLRSRHDPS